MQSAFSGTGSCHCVPVSLCRLPSMSQCSLRSALELDPWQFVNVVGGPATPTSKNATPRNPRQEFELKTNFLSQASSCQSKYKRVCARARAHAHTDTHIMQQSQLKHPKASTLSFEAQSGETAGVCPSCRGNAGLGRWALGACAGSTEAADLRAHSETSSSARHLPLPSFYPYSSPLGQNGAGAGPPLAFKGLRCESERAFLPKPTWAISLPIRAHGLASSTNWMSVPTHPLGLYPLQDTMTTQVPMQCPPPFSATSLSSRKHLPPHARLPAPHPLPELLDTVWG